MTVTALRGHKGPVPGCVRHRKTVLNLLRYFLISRLYVS